jgi:hypothetical protein
MPTWSPGDRATSLGNYVAQRKGSCSFLKKRTKKLLPVSGGTELSCLGSVQRAMCKSFLLLFFKKEDLIFSRMR